MLGQSYLGAGQLKEAQSTFEEVIEYCEKCGYEWIGATSQVYKGMILIAQGDLKQGLSLYENVMRVWLENKCLWRYANGNNVLGRLYSRILQEKAEEYFNIAIKTAGEIGAKSVLGRAYLGLGQLHKAKGETDKARECVSNAIEAFEKCEADVALKQAKEALAALG